MIIYILYIYYDNYITYIMISYMISYIIIYDDYIYIYTHTGLLGSSIWKEHGELTDGGKAGSRNVYLEIITTVSFNLGTENKKLI